jgi:hypothetical protein
VKKFVIAVLFAPLLHSPNAHAQYQHQNWWGISYSFLQMKTSEGVATEVGHIPMLNFELGVALTPKFTLVGSAGYGTDSLAFSGTNLQGATTNQYVPVTLLQGRLDGLFMFQIFYFNIGYGFRNFSDDINGSYSRTLHTTYLPLGIYYVSPPFYLHAEYRRYISGDEDIASLASPRHDVSLSQGGGGCYALEAGWVVQRPLGVKISLNYAVWNLDTSASAFDGLETLTEPSMQTTETSLAVGLLF